jgi:hypothetical protein
MSFGGTPDYAGMAIKNEKNRKGIINLGLNEINSIFGGGSAPFYSTPTGNFDPSQDYWAQGKTGDFVPAWTGGKAKGPGVRAGAGFNTGLAPHGALSAFAFGGGPIGNFFSGLFGDDPPSPKQYAESLFKQGKLFSQNNQTFTGFQPSFYNQRATDYVNYALPQLATQYQNTKNSLGFGLANRGLFGGSASDRQMSELDRETGQAKQQIADTGQNQANALQQQVASAKQNAITQLYQTADPSRATATAIDSAAQFRLPSSFAPLANMFSSLLNQYQTSQALNPSGGGFPFMGSPQYSVTGAALPSQ